MDPHIQTVRKVEKTAIVILLVICVLGGSMFGYITSEIKNFSGIENLRRFQPSVPTKLFDVNGELIAELFQEKRDLVAYEELPQNVINAFIATEDRDFYSHFGINPLAILRAFVKNILAGKITQGGSTITQQLAKRLFTTGARTLMRKILEAILALQIEKKFTKQEILEMYFNQIYLGHGCYGISAAGELFFGKNARHLNVSEGAVLAALPSAPGRNSPLKNPRNAIRANRDIMNRMVNNDFLTRSQADKAFQDFWPKYVDSIMTEFPSKTVFSGETGKAPFFTDYVRQILLARFGREAVYDNGLSVYTTLNLRRQESAEKHLHEGVRRQNEVSTRMNEYMLHAADGSLFRAYEVLRSVFSLPGVIVRNDFETMFKKMMVDELVDSMDIVSLLVDDRASNRCVSSFRDAITGISSTLEVEGAMIAIEPSTGYISVMVGGTEYAVSNQYNRAMQAKRQPGSAFKPFVYGAGIDSGLITAAMSLPDVPIVDIDASGESWAPANYEGGFSGMVAIPKALAKSINIISIRIYDIVGPDNIANFAARMCKVPETRFTPSPTLALGTTEMTPFEMATGFAVYANRGRDVIPFAIRYVLDRDGVELVNIEEEVGNIIAAKERNGTIQVIPEEVAFIMTNLLQGVITHGTPYNAVRVQAGFTKPCAGKTGTTSNWTDAWFCGFTPDIAAVVWVGYDRQFMSLGKNQAAASVAAPIWGYFMRDVYNGMPDPVFPEPPEGVYGSGNVYLKKGTHPGPYYDEKKYKMKTVIERYMEKEGLQTE